VHEASIAGVLIEAIGGKPGNPCEIIGILCGKEFRLNSPLSRDGLPHASWVRKIFPSFPRRRIVHSAPMLEYLSNIGSDLSAP
jgi:hypothetical protein